VYDIAIHGPICLIFLAYKNIIKTDRIGNLPRPTQPPTLSGTGNEYRPKCRSVMMLYGWGVKSERFIPFVDKGVGGT